MKLPYTLEQALWQDQTLHDYGSDAYGKVL